MLAASAMASAASAALVAFRVVGHGSPGFGVSLTSGGITAWANSISCNDPECIAAPLSVFKVCHLDKIGNRKVWPTFQVGAILKLKLPDQMPNGLFTGGAPTRGVNNSIT